MQPEPEPEPEPQPEQEQEQGQEQEHEQEQEQELELELGLEAEEPVPVLHPDPEPEPELPEPEQQVNEATDGGWEEWAAENLAAARAVMRQLQPPPSSSREGSRSRRSSSAAPRSAAAKQRAARRQAAKEEAAKAEAARIAADDASHAHRMAALKAAADRRQLDEASRALMAPVAARWRASRPGSAPALSRRVRSDTCQIGVQGRVVTASPECWPADSYAVHIARQEELRQARAEDEVAREASHAGRAHRNAQVNAERCKAAAQAHLARADIPTSRPHNPADDLRAGPPMVDYKGCGESVRVGHYDFHARHEHDTPKLSHKQVKEKLQREAAAHSSRRKRAAKRVVRRERAVLASIVANYTQVAVDAVRPVSARVVCSVRPEANGCCIVELSHDRHTQQGDEPVADRTQAQTKPLTVTLRQTAAALTHAEDWISGEQLRWTGRTLKVTLPAGDIRYIRCSRRSNSEAGEDAA